MFNYHLPEVQSGLQTVRDQAARAEEIDGQLKQAVQVIQQGAWLGESAQSFETDAARLEASIDELEQELARFIANLTQASGYADDASTAIRNLVASLPA